MKFFNFERVNNYDFELTIRVTSNDDSGVLGKNDEKAQVLQ